MWGQISVTISACPGHLSGAGHDEWDQGACQARAGVGACSACQVLVYIEPQHLSGAGSCSACQVLVYGELTVLVRCWLSQHLSGAGIGISPWCQAESSACQTLVYGRV